jgi:hypothetical protein
LIWHRREKAEVGEEHKTASCLNSIGTIQNAQ